MTRPARSSSTAASGIPAMMAFTAWLSTGLLIARKSSFEVAALCSRHGIRAAPATQANTAAASVSESSPDVTTTASARPATSRMMAECRKRSGQENKGGGPSRGIGPALSRAYPLSEAGFATLSDIGRLAPRLRIEPWRRTTHALHSRTQYKFAEHQQDDGKHERRNVIKHAKKQHAGQQVLAVHLPQPHKHGRVEHPEPTRGMTGEAQQCRRDEDNRDHNEPEVGLIRHQHIHCQRAETEVDDSDRDLQQRQRAARQYDRP